MEGFLPFPAAITVSQALYKHKKMLHSKAFFFFLKKIQTKGEKDIKYK